MKAIIVSEYGGPEVLQLQEIPKPKPLENEVLIKIYTAAVNQTDPVFRKGEPFISRFFTGLLKPKYSIPGDVLAGEIVKMGKEVNRFKPGDRVFGFNCDTLGAHSEYICLCQDGAIALISQGISYEEAAGIVDGGHTALVFLRDKANIRPGQRVLVNGASGSVGTAAVQIALSYGAEVTGVCSASNAEMVLSLGAKKVIDYTTVDFTREKDPYDILFDTVAKKSFSQCKKVLSENGIYLTTFPTAGVLLRGIFQSKKKGKRALFKAAGLTPPADKKQNLEFLMELLSNKKLKTVIDREYPLKDIAEAHRYVEQGHKKGNVLLNISE